MEQNNIFEKIGGHEKIGHMVEDFYNNVLQDDSLKDFFGHVDMEKQKKHQTNFLSFALGGPNQYSGKTLAKAHEGLSSTHEHFDAILSHLKQTMQNHELDENHIDEIITNLSQYRKDIVRE